MSKSMFVFLGPVAVQPEGIEVFLVKPCTFSLQLS